QPQGDVLRAPVVLVRATRGGPPGPRSAGSSVRALAFATLLGACGGDAPGSAAVPDPGLGPPEPPVYTVFEPATLDPGDTVAGLAVESFELTRVFEASAWAGEVAFVGDLVLHGIYQRHPDWPAVEAPCMEVVQSASIARVPRFPPDAYTGPGQRTWFCFENPEVALELMGEPEPPREVVIAVDRYVVVREFTDAFDVARLAELLEVGPTSTPTLVGP